MQAGLRRDWKSVGAGVCELRVDYGPGYRIYFAQDGAAVVLLLCGGDQRSQKRDIADGDPRLVPVVLRAITNAVGGMAALAERTGLSRETLYRTLSEKGNPRLDTLAAILKAFGLRIAVAPARKRAIGERC